jgi:hypothetical protein
MVLIPVIALGIAAVSFLLFLGSQVWRQSGNNPENGNPLPVDLEAFRNLTDPEETRFLRVNLAPKDFRRIQRHRLRAAAAYIGVISDNASRLVAIGRSLSAHPDAVTAAAGLDVVHRGLQLKFWCLLSLLKLNLTLVWPTILSPSSRIADRYRDVSSLTDSLPRKLAAPTSA